MLSTFKPLFLCTLATLQFQLHDAVRAALHTMPSSWAMTLKKARHFKGFLFFSLNYDNISNPTHTYKLSSLSLFKIFFFSPGLERALSSSLCSIKTTCCIILYSVQFYSFWINFILSFLALNPILTQKAQLLLIKVFCISNLYSQI